jgi:hypothetical protein
MATSPAPWLGLQRFAGSGFARYRETGDDAVYDAMSLRDAVKSYAAEPLVSERGVLRVISDCHFADSSTTL